MKPRISVCIPTCNRAHTLRETIRDIQAQTVDDWEIVVSDDASTDDTAAMIASLREPRLIYHRQPRNLGIYPNWNFLLQQARGDYVCIYHDHDVYLPTILETSRALLDRDPSVPFAHTALVLIDDQDEPVALDIRDFPDVLSGAALRQRLAQSLASPIMAATVMARRDAYQAVGGYDAARYGLGCDKDMWFRLAARGGVGYVAQPQALIRARAKSGATSRFNWRNLAGEIDMQRDQLAAVFPPGDPTGESLARQARRRWAHAIFINLVRAVVLEPAGLPEGEALLRRYGSSVQRVVLAALKRSRLLPALLKRWALPWHYRRLERHAQRLRQTARGFWERHPEFEQELDRRRARAGVTARIPAPE